MQMTFLGLAGPSSIGKSTCNGVDYTSDLIGGFFYLWRLSFTLLLLVSLSVSVIYSSFYFLVPVLLLFTSFRVLILLGDYLVS